MKAIRNEYAEQGVETFYKTNADVYENPHFPYIENLLQKNKERIDYTYILDFCCGGGEVTMALQKIGFSNSIGCDPFTHTLFEKNTKKVCFSYSFEDIVKGNFTFVLPNPETQNPKYDTPSVFSAIICSFAMHLCPDKMLQPLVLQLFSLAKYIVIITPHKRPELEKIEGIYLDFEDFVLTKRGKKVFLKIYQHQYGLTAHT
jgi:SAM-dependent methyltransferase